MIDLSLNSTRKYWQSQEDSSLFKIITFIESVEKWTLDGEDSIENALNSLSDSFDNLPLVDIRELNIDEQIINILSYIKLGRAIRILQILDENNPGYSSRLIMFSEENRQNDSDIYGIFLKRNLMFERVKLSSRAFSDNRIKMLVQALED
jgi:intracellular multiplication protein IcmW